MFVGFSFPASLHENSLSLPSLFPTGEQPRATDKPGYRRDDRERPTGVRPSSLPSLFPAGEPLRATDERGGYRRDDCEQPPSLCPPSLFRPANHRATPSGSGSGPDSSVPCSSLSALPLFAANHRAPPPPSSSRSDTGLSCTLERWCPTASHPPTCSSPVPLASRSRSSLSALPLFAVNHRVTGELPRPPPAPDPTPACLVRWNVGARPSHTRQPVDLQFRSHQDPASALVQSVDSFALVSSFLPNGGPTFSMAIYPSEFGIQRMEEEEIYGPVGLFDDEDDRNEDHLDEKQETLGEILNGDRLVTAPYEVKFLQGKDQEVVCKEVDK
ncbi:hypothetical protein ACJRO7_026894 [Eucalyptus globulus]|uniref:ESF1 RRM domain-containing protein n=1 Tax=Eucalyptus globulus TaxID=34317 RepID=A0ABD3JZQ0_EUCGL